MNQKQCAEIQARFSSYLDGAISGHEMQEISQHIDGFDDASRGTRVAGCEACAQELTLRGDWTQDAVSTLGPAEGSGGPCAEASEDCDVARTGAARIAVYRSLEPGMG